MISHLLLILAWSLSLSAQALTFKQAYETKVMGIDGLSSEDLEVALKKAMEYANYRKYPKSDTSKELWQVCLDYPSTNILCEVITKGKVEPEAAVTPLAVRTKLNAALLSLDNMLERPKTCPEAVKVFQAVAQDSTLYTYHSRALYWSWICANVLRNTSEAQTIKERLWAQFPLSHHTLRVLAQDRDGRIDTILRSDRDFKVLLRSEKLPELNPWIEAIEALQRQGEDGAAAVVALHINQRIRDLEPEVRLYLAVLMSQVSESIPSVLPMPRILLPLFLDKPEYMTPSTLKLLFPLNYRYDKVSQERASLLEMVNQYRGNIDTSIFLGLIHLESALNPRAASKAGAFGLTQMLLATATDQYRKLKKDPNAKVDQEMLFKPRLSIELGAMDYRWRSSEFDNDLVLTLASYNAGVAGVKKWVGEVKKINSQQLLMDVLFLNRPAEYHVSQYVGMILARSDWYEKLYPQLHKTGN